MKLVVQAALAVVLGVVGSAALARQGPPDQPILDIEGSTLTASATIGPTSAQNLRPTFTHRGVDIDGTLRASSGFGWALWANPLDGGYTQGRMLGDVSLFTGGYQPTEVDLVLPSLGPPVTIGRAFNGLQKDGTAFVDSDGVQGRNWSQLAQPEIVFAARGAGDADDVVYLVYGADRLIEFLRAASGSDLFKAKNGAAGYMVRTVLSPSGVETFTYYDQRGTRAEFFGFNTQASGAAGQFWRSVDPAGKTVYVHNSVNPADAISKGYSLVGGVPLMQELFDGSGRKYAFSYASIGGAQRLTLVRVTVPPSTSAVAEVQYDYYTINGTNGLAGDLKSVTVTQVGSGYTFSRTRYYRYYTTSWANVPGQRGHPHLVKAVVNFEGVRSAPQAVDNMTDAALQPYADAWFEYGADRRVSSVTLSGSCGCAGGASGAHAITYQDVANLSTWIGNTVYNDGLASRAQITQPDGTLVDQYFDETGQVLSRATSKAASSWGSGAWVNHVLRNGGGRVTTVYSPEAVTAYDSTNWTVTTGNGLITEYTLSSTAPLQGFRTATALRQGTGSPVTISSRALSHRRLHMNATIGVDRPLITSTTVYPAPSVSEVTTYAYDYWQAPNTSAIAPESVAFKSITVTNPVVPTTSNGSNVATTSTRYFRKDESVAYSRDALERYTYTARDGFGQTSRNVADAAPGSASAVVDYSADLPSQWGLAASGDRFEVVTDMTYDSVGRVLSVTTPTFDGSTRTAGYRYLIQSDTTLAALAYASVSGSTFTGPVSLTVTNHAGRPVRRATISISNPPGAAITALAPTSDWSGMVDSIYDPTGTRLLETRTFTSTTAFDSTTYFHDDLGRVIRVKDPTGTIRRTDYDRRGLPVARSIGTGDAGLPGGSGASNMVTTETMTYTNNGHLSSRSLDVDGNPSTPNARVTTHHLDFRGRLIAQVGPVPPFRVFEYDDLDRVVQAAEYSNSAGLDAFSKPSTSTNRISFATTSYDPLGRVFRSDRDGLITDTWFDEVGRPIKVRGQELTKTEYDALGRTIRQSILATTNDAATDYAAAKTLAGDVVLEERRSVLEPKTGLPRLTYTVQRHHDNSVTVGSLDANTFSGSGNPSISGASLFGRIQITAFYFDSLNRLTDSVQHGTAGFGAPGAPASFSRPPAPPARPAADTALLTSQVYDGFGRVEDVIDPSDITTRTVYDFAGRRERVIENYQDGIPAAAEPDLDRVVEYTYAAGLVTAVTRVMPSAADNQVTTYTYAVSPTTGSQFTASNVLSAVTLPEQTTGQPAAERTTTYRYNALGEVISTTDPAGNEISTSYDGGGRVVARTIDVFAANFDDRVKSVQTEYDPRGRVARVRQLSPTSVVLDEVAMAYNDWNRLTELVQDPDSGLNPLDNTSLSGRDPFVSQWTYAVNADPAARSNIYLASAVQPGLTHVEPVYGAPEVFDFAMRRAVGMKVGSGDLPLMTPVADYTYLGLGSVVGVEYPEAQVASRLYDPNATGSDPYAAFLDPLTRPSITRWAKTTWASGGTEPRFVDFEIRYANSGNPVSIADLALAAGDAANTVRNFDRFAVYDTLQRVSELHEGELDANSSSIAVPSRLQVLGRNSAGRVSRDRVDLNGNGVFTNGPPDATAFGEMDDTRVYNKRNELRERAVLDSTNPTTPRGVSLDYDRNGNLTSDGEKHTYTFNPFGQLVRINDFATRDLIARFTYNGLGQRISEQTDVSSPGTPGEPDGLVTSDDPVFYLAIDPQGRRVATYRDQDRHPKETFVWTLAGIAGPGGVANGTLILRDRNEELSTPENWAKNEGSDGRPERHYSVSDHTGSVVALLGLHTVNDGPTAKLAEQYRYSVTGVPYGIPLGDVDASGGVEDIGGGTSLDKAIVADLETQSLYQVRGDLNLDGLVNSDDVAIVDAALGRSLGRGSLSIITLRNRVGLGQLERTLRVGPGWSVAGGMQWEETAITVSQQDPANVPLAFSRRPVIDPWGVFPWSPRLYRECESACMRSPGAEAVSWCFEGRETICICSVPISPFRPSRSDPSKPIGPGDLPETPRFRQCLIDFENRNFDLGILRPCLPGSTGRTPLIPLEQQRQAACLKADNHRRKADCYRAIECPDGDEGKACRFWKCYHSYIDDCLSRKFDHFCTRGMTREAAKLAADEGCNHSGARAASACGGWEQVQP